MDSYFYPMRRKITDDRNLLKYESNVGFKNALSVQAVWKYFKILALAKTAYKIRTMSALVVNICHISYDNPSIELPVQ